MSNRIEKFYTDLSLYPTVSDYNRDVQRLSLANKERRQQKKHHDDVVDRFTMYSVRFEALLWVLAAVTFAIDWFYPQPWWRFVYWGVVANLLPFLLELGSEPNGWGKRWRTIRILILSLSTWFAVHQAMAEHAGLSMIICFLPIPLVWGIVRATDRIANSTQRSDELATEIRACENELEPLKKKLELQRWIERRGWRNN